MSPQATRRQLMGLALLAPLRARADIDAPEALRVLHWWTSRSERQGAAVLARALASEGLTWRDSAIPGGGGPGLAKVLRSRVLVGDAPEVNQILGPSIGEWADLGLLLELDDVAQGWDDVLFPAVARLIRHREHVMAAPLGIHRVNNLLMHRELMQRHRVDPPQRWSDVEQWAARLQAAGITPLAQSSEPWQVAMLFENLLLAGAGALFYRELLVQRRPAALQDPRLLTALRRLRQLRRWMGPRLEERPWTEVLDQLVHGRAAMMVSGDWAVAELSALGVRPQIEVLPVPGSERWHLYSVDSLCFFAGDFRRTAEQWHMARLLVSPAVQADYNRAKGSVPVRRDAVLRGFDPAAQASWQTFAEGEGAQVPSLTHRMVLDDGGREALIAELHRYFMDERWPEATLLRRMGAILRASPR